ncbi:hypothetical protein HPB52_004685 [Rhipicephalus sanguineus]|uniref:THAP-type domain-containing protein n=1 Tax=Rhipicephalus sanguineus TaxID=34632 RepID=A0A9D4T6W8_RHISA|nr:hypothetical protein HPB52_004685 [Rhipicephalus sanguineus]
MPGCCCAPNCKSNYAGEPSVRVHVFPNDPVRRAAWTRAVPRKDFAPTKNTVLCEKHFLASDYVKTSKYTDQKTGKIIEVPLKVFRLKPDAMDSKVLFLDLTVDRGASVRSSVIVQDSMCVEVYFGETLIVELDGVSVPAELQDLRQLCDILHHVERLRTPDASNNVQWARQLLATVMVLLEELICNDQQHQLHGWHLEIVKFIKSQVELILNNAARYSPDLLVFASLLYTISPHAYRFLRGSSGARTLVFSSKCPREGGTRVVIMPPPKEHLFNVRTPPGTSADEVIDAMEALLGIQEIYSVQHHGGFDFQVSVNSIGAVQVLLETGGLRLGTRTVPLVPVARQVVSVTYLYLPCYVPANEVVTGLKSYGTTLRIEEARYKDRPCIRTGTRYIKMDMRWKTHFRTSREWEAIEATLRRNVIPRTARVFGHRTDTCTEPCRRCGGAHSSLDCTARKTYSMASATDVDEFATLGAAPAAGQTQRRLTTLRPANRLKPSEGGPEPNVILEKTLAQATAITAPAEQQEGRQAVAQTPASMCSQRSEETQEEEGSHSEPNQAAAAAEGERAADSGERG